MASTIARFSGERCRSSDNSSASIILSSCSSARDDDSEKVEDAGTEETLFELEAVSMCCGESRNSQTDKMIRKGKARMIILCLVRKDNGRVCIWKSEFLCGNYCPSLILMKLCQIRWFSSTRIEWIVMSKI